MYRGVHSFRFDDDHPNRFRAYEEATALLIFEDHHPIELVGQVCLCALRICKSNSVLNISMADWFIMDFRVDR